MVHFRHILSIYFRIFISTANGSTAISVWKQLNIMINTLLTREHTHTSPCVLWHCCRYLLTVSMPLADGLLLCDRVPTERADFCAWIKYLFLMKMLVWPRLYPCLPCFFRPGRCGRTMPVKCAETDIWTATPTIQRVSPNMLTSRTEIWVRS